VYDLGKRKGVYNGHGANIST